MMSPWIGSLKARFRTFAGRLSCGWVLVAALTSCASTPDLRPFAEATAQIAVAVEENHDGIVRELDLLNKDDEYADEAKSFKSSAQKIEGAVESLVRYSDSLAAIADAGRQGEANARALGSSLNDLVSALGFNAKIPGTALELGAIATGAIVDIVASRKIAKSLVKADPIIEAATALLEKEMKVLDSILEPDKVEAGIHDRLKMACEERSGVGLGDRVKLVNALADVQRACAKNGADRVEVIKSNAAISETDPARVKAANDAQPDPVETDPAKVKAVNDARLKVKAANDARRDQLEMESRALTQDVKLVRGWIKLTDEWYLPLQADLAEVSERFADHRLLVDETRRALRRWRTVHAELTSSAQSGDLKYTVRLLQNTVQRMKDVLDEGERQ